MCDFLSGVTIATGDVALGIHSDSHEDIIEWAGWREADKRPGGLCRWEYVPVDGDYSGEWDTWELRIDERVAPDWWTEGHRDTAISRALAVLPQLMVRAGETRDVVRSNERVARNDGTVTDNDGTVTDNYGTVKSNYGTVKSNYGMVTNNCGTVTNNYNYGTVTDNCGTVTRNYNYGTVTRNDGIVTNNCGTVTNNHGTVTRNHGIVIDYRTTPPTVYGKVQLAK